MHRTKPSTSQDKVCVCSNKRCGRCNGQPAWAEGHANRQAANAPCVCRLQLSARGDTPGTCATSEVVGSCCLFVRRASNGQTRLLRMFSCSRHGHTSPKWRTGGRRLGSPSQLAGPWRTIHGRAVSGGN
eukprot:5609097-Alexandrium_andersonii.AAC.1